MNSSLFDISTLKLSLSLSFLQDNFLEKETTRLASVRLQVFFSFLSSFFVIQKFCRPNQILKCPIFGAHILKTIGTAERSDEDFERHFTPFHPLHHPQRDQVSW
jgi:hypothetical protein